MGQWGGRGGWHYYFGVPSELLDSASFEQELVPVLFSP